MNLLDFKPGDAVVVNINSGMGLAPLWVRATVTKAADLRYGWVMARTNSDSTHPGIERGPGWMSGEILPAEGFQG